MTTMPPNKTNMNRNESATFLNTGDTNGGNSYGNNHGRPPTRFYPSGGSPNTVPTVPPPLRSASYPSTLPNADCLRRSTSSTFPSNNNEPPKRRSSMAPLAFAAPPPPQHSVSPSPRSGQLSSPCNLSRTISNSSTGSANKPHPGYFFNQTSPRVNNEGPYLRRTFSNVSESSNNSAYFINSPNNANPQSNGQTNGHPYPSHGGSSNDTPTEFNNNYTSSSSRGKKSLNSRRTYQVFPWILTILSLIFSIHTHRKSSSLDTHISELEDLKNIQAHQFDIDLTECKKSLSELNQKASDYYDLKKDYNNAQKELFRLHHVTEDYKLEISNYQDKVEALSSNYDRNEVHELKSRESTMQNRMISVITAFQKENQRILQERYGKGPYRVTFLLDLQIQGKPDLNPHFTIQLFPSQKLSHTALFFLEQVRHKLWDGNYFTYNMDHILQASAGNNRHQFEHLALDTVAFQEYSYDHPHTTWTVGIGGRPGGPDFYINKIDNTKLHGPGGQGRNILSEEADPCFAEVVWGKEFLQSIFNMPVNEKSVLNTPVRIKSAFIEGIAEKSQS